MRSHYSINPESLSDEEWAKLYQEYNYVKKVEYKNLMLIVEAGSKKALVQVANEIIKGING